MTNTERRLIAIRRESRDNRARLRCFPPLLLSNKARQEQIQQYLATQAKTIALPSHNGEGRKESGHSYARHRSLAPAKP